jgi:hypothetical protein
MSVVTVRKFFARSEWRRAFADTLIKLRPDMNPDAADELSDTAWGELSRLPPVEAAQACASEERPVIPPSPEERASGGDG